MPRRVEVYQNGSGQWRFKLVEANNETITSSEGYTRKFDAVRAAKDAHPDEVLEISDAE